VVTCRHLVPRILRRPIDRAPGREEDHTTKIEKLLDIEGYDTLEELAGAVFPTALQAPRCRR
jgi:hypothetical protein